MKNIDETITTVFDRIGQYREKQKRKKHILVRTVTPLCCLCILAAIGIGVWRKQPETPQKLMEDALYPGIPDTVEPGQTEPTDPAPISRIIINRLDANYRLKTDFAIEGICLLGDDFVPMTEAELNDYYGINIFPAVPEDIPAWEDQRLGIYKRDGGTGEVYWDSIVLNYDNKDFTRSVNIEIDKGNLPFVCCVFFETIEERSLINGTEVAIGLSDSGYYYAEFIYKDVGFRLIAEGITEDELVSIISSLIV